MTRNRRRGDFEIPTVWRLYNGDSLSNQESIEMSKNMNSDSTHRRFLRNGSIAGAAMLGFPTLIPRHVLATQTTPGANEPIVVGIIGMRVRARWRHR